MITAVADFGGRQHRTISAEQLAGLGVTRWQLRIAETDGWLQKAAPRVWVMAGSPDRIERRQWIALLCLGTTAVLSHETAARLHRFDRHLPDVVELTLPRVGRGRHVAVKVHTTAALDRPDVVAVGGFRCTSATRTVIDLARARISTVRLEAAIDSAVRSGASSPIVIARRLASMRGPGRWGAPRLDALLLDAGGHTFLERRFLELMRRAGFPRPRTQVVQRRDTRTVARVDFLFEPYDVMVEVSGRRGHASDAERARDAQRRNELQDVGHRVYEYTYDDVTKRPTSVIDTMHRRLVAAGWSGGVR